VSTCGDKYLESHRTRARIFGALGLAFLLAGGVSPGAEAAAHPKAEIGIRKIDAAAAAQVSYARHVAPIFANNCADCHSEDDQKSGLDTSSVASLLKGGKKAGAAVVPGKPDDSPLVQYLRGLREPQMPKGNPALSEEDLHLIREWIFAGARDDSASVASEEKANSSSAAGATAGVAVDSPGMQKALNDLLFSGNGKDRFFAQRRLRLALLPNPLVPPPVKAPVFNPIDQFIVAKWEQAGLKEARQPPAECSDAAFLRRVYLDIIGVIPTVAEAKQFLEDTTPDKRVRLVDELLARNEDYAAHWTPFWEEAIGSSDVGITGGIGSRGNHRQWIYENFVHNKPFDLMVAELIDPMLPGYRKPEVGEANGKRVVSGYIRNESHLETIQSAANVAQVFMGTEMKCASCHNHFLNKEWPQARFLAFAGMFATNDLESIRCEKRSGQYVKAKFPFELPGVPESVPKPIDERLHRVAQLIVDPTNPRFAQTIMNRLWKRYLGLGLFEPQDDFRPDHPPTNPELLAWLADDFMRRGYDLKHSIRLILTSRTYQLRYDPELEDHFDVNHPEQARYYRSPSLRRLTAEELLDSIQVATSQGLDAKRRIYLTTASTALTRALGRPALRNEISTARSGDVAVVQALELLNGEEFYERVYLGRVVDQAADELFKGVRPSPGAATQDSTAAAPGLTAIAAPGDGRTPTAASHTAEEAELGKVIDRLYWMALSRPASAREQEVGSSFLKTSLPEPKPVEEPQVEQVWLEDDLPQGASPAGTGDKEAWQWVSKPDAPVFSGQRAHTQGGKGEQRQHHFSGAAKPLCVGPEDVLFTYVYLDPKAPPREIMLQWNNGTWDQRAYWGEDRIPFGEANTASRRRLGPLPAAGEWVRLEVPAREVGISGPTDIAGWSFDQFGGGAVYWDKSGVVKRPRNPEREPVGDLLWALVTSPEFQYIH
jgi:mono/diheme cytochrome c family protein